MKVPFIIVIGHNAAGKSTLSKKLINTFKLNRVNGDIVRDLIIENIDYYSDINYSHFTEKVHSMNKITDVFRQSLLQELIQVKAPILIDGASVTKKARARYLDLVINNKSYTTIIIEASVEEKKLIERLKNRDKNNIGHQWFQQYIQKKKAMYELVDITESDHYVKYNQNNFEEITKELKKVSIIQEKELS
jgi:adenylate kinase family enzyme